MTEPLQVGQFAIVDHEPVEMGPNAGIFRGKGPADDRSELYVIAEGTSPAGEAHAGHLLSTLGSAWGGYDLSLTGALQRLFTEASRDLRDWNRKSIPEHRARIGMSCFARRGNQAVIAQAGPSVAYHIHGGTVRTIRPIGDSIEPLGGPKEQPPYLARVDLAPGDRLLIMTTSADSQLDEELVNGILGLPGEQVLAELYHRVDHVRNMSAILIARTEQPASLPTARRRRDEEFVIDATGAMPALPPASSAPTNMNADDSFQPSLFIDQAAGDVIHAAKEALGPIARRPGISADVPDVAIDIPRPLRRVSGDDSFARAIAERSATAASSIAIPARRIMPPASMPVTDTGRMIDSGNRSKRRESFSRSLSAPEGPFQPVVEGIVAPPVAELAADRQSTLLGPTWAEPLTEANGVTLGTDTLVRIRPKMSGRWKGGSGGGHRIDLHGHGPRPWLVIAGGLGLLALVVAFLVLPRFMEEQSGKRYTTLMDGASQQLANASVQSDPGERRKALTAAQANLLEAGETSQATSEVGEMLTQVNALIATLDNVKAPSSVETVGSLEQFGDRPVAAVRMVVGKSEGYILDSASSQVIAVSLADGRNKAIFAENKDEKRARPIAIAYYEGTELGSEALIIADSQRNFWAYNPDRQLRLLTVTAPAGMQVTDIAANGRDLYVLDSGSGSIYQFTISELGFSGGQKVVDNTTLANARRLTVDGEFFTADDKGTVHRYSGQLELTLSQAGIDKPLVSDETPQLLGKAGDIVFADSANDRLVVLKRDGTFDSQYRHKDFASLSALAIRGDTLYVFSGGILRKVTL